jgi:hypothetical protein
MTITRWRFAARVLSVALTLVTSALGAADTRADSPPTWVREAMDQAVAESLETAPAVALIAESLFDVDRDGHVVERFRSVVRILTREGASAARTEIPYCTDGGGVRDLRGWLVAPDGSARTLGARHMVDLARLGNGLYDEHRVRRLDAAAEALPGATFACEWTCEGTYPILQLEHAFQGEIPVLRSRLTVRPPAGWTVVGRFAGHEVIEPRREAGAFVWELRGLASVPDEPLRPPDAILVPRVLVTILPPLGEPAGAAQVFQGWADVARWLHDLAVDSSRPDEMLANRARDVVSGARSELDTLRALGRFVQGIRYASIQLGTSRGGGYRPHPPGKVLARGYGDCKDKANLLRALAAAVGHPAYLVAVHASDPFHARDDWATPVAFDHCVVALPLRESHGLAAEVRHARLGPLLVFDPTNPHTVFGSLPAGQQGGLALLEDPGDEEPFRLPETTPEANRITRRVEVTLDATGAAEVELSERCYGDAAAQARAMRCELDARDYRRALERWLTHAEAGAILETADVREDTLGEFETRLTFRVPRLAQPLQSHLLVIKPLLLSPDGLALSADRPRRCPAVLDRQAVRETLLVRPPAGFRLDELPAAVELEFPFGRYALHAAQEGDWLRLDRALTVPRAWIAAEGFPAVRDFFARVGAAERAPIVLARR